jgi:hypothetical protein
MGSADQGERMNDTLLEYIDTSLRELSGRELVAGSEVVNLLLDLRMLADQAWARELEAVR